MTEPQDYPSYPSDPPPRDDGPRLPAARAPRPASTGHLVGRVEGVTTRVESYGHERSSETVLSFRLTDAGERPVEVELRGHALSGTVRDGDWVEVADQRRQGRVEVATLSNLTTDAQVRAVGSPRSTGVRAFKVVFLILFLAIVAVFVAVVVMMMRDASGLGF